MSVQSFPLRSELAIAAARLIAEEGCDYGTAKRRAVQELFGDRSDSRRVMPDNRAIEHELRRHLRLFAAETHPPLLAALRRVAAAVMDRMAAYDPHLVGAVLNGTATEHSDIHLQLFVDSVKDVELALLDARIDFDAHESDSNERSAPLEMLSFTVPAREPGLPVSLRCVGVQLHLYPRDGLRIAPRGRSDDCPEAPLHPVELTGRANREDLRRLLEERPG
jgi:hypothetical protein